MKQSFNRLCRVWHQLRTDPYLPPAMLGYSVLLLAFCITSDALWLGAAIAWVALIYLLTRTCPYGRPRWLARQLTPNFFSVRLLPGRWTIFQRRAVGGKGQPDCRQLLKELLADQRRLPDALALAPGRYKTTTHDTVLNRLRKMQNARITSEKPVYTSTMAAICSAMTGGRCKKCKKTCPFLTQREQARQFYEVKFEIISL